MTRIEGLPILEDQLQKIATNQQTFEAKVIETAQRQDADMSQLRHQVTAQIDAQGTRMENVVPSTNAKY